ncbi:MAG: CotH kinase family protein [Crocinitomicaceae bacterium]|nr:CotH kinase family protein [Crocinitomicaceae bacterium]MBK8927180.1 CotH kinase family protein [Crocinitomicaceae bacterium]
MGNLKLRYQFLLLIALMHCVHSHAQILFDPTTKYAQAGQFYHYGHISTLSINFYNPDHHAILKYWKENYIENALPATLTYGSIFLDSVAVKYKGNSTFAVPNMFGNQKLPYNIDLNDLISGQQIQGFRKLKLGNAWFDPTFCKELMASFIYKQYMPCYEANLVRLVVNGNYLGVYVNQEDVGYQFLKKHFGENDGAFFKCEPMTEEQAGHPVDWPGLVWEGSDTLDYYESYERKSPTGWTEFLEMIYTLNINPGNIESVINVDRVLWNFAVSQVLSNEDTYNTTIIHNYYMYQTADGKFQMLPWDLTESFCGILFSGGSPESHYELDPLYGLSPYFSDRPLVFQLLSNDYYRKKYFAHIRTIMNEYYSATWIKDWITARQSTAYSAVNSDPNKPHNMTKFTQNVDSPVNYLLMYTIAGITDVITNRKPYLENYSDLTYSAPLISGVTQSIQHPSADDTVFISAQVSNATGVSLKVTNNPAPYASDFTTITMTDDGLNGDLVAGDGIYTAEVPYHTSNDHVKYYIEAENAQAMKLNPERAEFFYYHYYIDQVVSAKEKSKPQFAVYPIPADHEINIQPMVDDKLYDVLIYNKAGQVVYKALQLSGHTQIEVSELIPGNYILEISTEKNTQRSKVIIL